MFLENVNCPSTNAKQDYEKIDFPYCPFEPFANQPSQSSPFGQIGCPDWLVVV